ncbi:MAG: hypothetical protein R3E66_12210 [bacterium]
MTKATAVMLVAGRQKDVADGHEMFLAAQRLAPDLPYPYFAHASYLIDRDIGGFARWVSAGLKGYRVAWQWPDTRFPWSLKLLVFGLLALLAASFAFIVAQTVRQFGIVAYDLARVLPKGFSSNQTVVLLLGIIIVPGVVLKSPLLALLTLGALLSVSMRWNERFVAALVFALLASMPWVDRTADNLASYSASPAQALFTAQYVACDAACIEDLSARRQASPDDAYVLFTELLALYRTGDKSAMKRIVEEVPSTSWPAAVAPYAYNLAGVAELALGNADPALDWFQKASSGMNGQAAPAFNAMRAHQMKDDLDAASRSLAEATARNIEQVSVYLTYDRRDVNSFMMAPGLPLGVFWDYHLVTPREARSVITPYWQAIAGKQFELGMSQWVGVAGLLWVLLWGLLRLRARMSTPCPKCGLARDPRDDKTTGAHHLCLPCYRTFVTGAGLDYRARVYNEKVLGGRSRLQSGLRRVGSVIAPGAGHHLAGRSITGFSMGTSAVLGLLLAVFPLGIVRPAQELGSNNWGGGVTVGWLLVSIVLLIALNAALRDIEPVSVGQTRRPK